MKDVSFFLLILYSRMLPYYNLWSPLSSSKNAIVIEHVFTDVAVVFPKLSNISWIYEAYQISEPLIVLKHINLIPCGSENAF